MVMGCLWSSCGVISPVSDYRLAAHLYSVILPRTMLAFALRLLHDLQNLILAHELEAMPTVFELGHGVVADHCAALAEIRDVDQFLFKAIDQLELIRLADFVSRDADNLPGAAREVDQALVADDYLHIPALLLGVPERHKVGVTKNRVGFQAHLRTLRNGSNQRREVALQQGWRGGCGYLRNLQVMSILT
jgi:hypothetical protein